MRPIKYQLGKTIVYRGNRYTVHPSALNSSNLSVEIPNIEILGTDKRPKVLTDDEQQIVNNQRQSEINEGENTHPVINAINQYAREFKYDLKNNKVPSGKYTYPAVFVAGTGLGALFQAPTATIASGIGGTVGDLVWNQGTKAITGKSWEDKVHDWTGLDKNPAALTNPGAWIGSVYGGVLPYKARISMYNNIIPAGYKQNLPIEGIKSKRDQIKNFITETINPFKWKIQKSPYYKTIIQNQENSQNHFMAGPDLTDGAATEFRDMIYRKALKLPENKNGTIFVENSDGTLGVDMEKVNAIRKQFGSKEYDNIVPVAKNNRGQIDEVTDWATGADIITGVGGHTDAVINYGFDKYTKFPTKVIETDTWDVQPFKDARRTIWSKGSKYIPGLKNFEVIKFFGGKPPKIKYEIDNPKIKYFNLNQ